MRGFGLSAAVLSLWAMGSVSLATASVPDSEREPVLTIRVYDYASERSTVVDRALGLASRILAKGGVRSVWLLCATSDTRQVVDEGCRTNPGLPEILLRLLPKSQKAISGTSNATLGYALIPTSGLGYMAGVRMDRVAQYVKRLGVPRDAVLGYVMAHEVGHLLLGAGSHAVSGIMAEQWGWNELAARGGLRFLPRAAQRIRANVLERVRAEKGLQQPAGAVRLFRMELRFYCREADSPRPRSAGW